jgi:protein-S-isoprenylcysteine O-methyltransferase Ste14
MMDPGIIDFANCSQMVTLGFLTAYLVVFFCSIFWVKRKGKDPMGATSKYGSLAKLSSVFTALWVAILLLCSFYPEYTNYVYPFLEMASNLWVISGFVIMGIGFVLEATGIYTLGENFRVSFPKEKTALVTRGIYGKTRNPIVLSVFLFVLGTFLVSPNVLTFINLIGNMITFNAKASDEERFLAKRFGRRWKSYAARTGKYLPRLSQS